MKAKRFMLSTLIGLVILTACADNNTLAGQGLPTSPPALSDACDVADRFLKAWEANDYATMYGLLSAKSLQSSQTQFAAAYQQADKTMVSPAKSHKLDCANAVQQGTTAAITYDMTFKGATVGEFTDPKRTMRLILSPRGWRIAWSSMDIFEGMAGGATLQLNYTAATRGTIYDRNDKPLAQDNQTLYTARLLTQSYPGKPEDCFSEIAKLFKRRYVDVVARYKSLTGLQYGQIVGHFDQETYDAKHSELDAVCRIEYLRDTTRVYYGNGLAAQSIGYIGAIPDDNKDRYLGYPPGSLVGRDGIEASLETQLSGKPSAELSIRLPNGTLLRTIAKQEGSPSQDVKLTIDRDLQAATEQAISDAYNAAAPNWAQYSTGTAVVVIKIDTGEILAIASYPTFDVDMFNLNTQYKQEDITDFQKVKPFAQSAFFNLVTQEYSPLGSVFKIVTMAAAADSGTFKLTDTYNCTGKWYGTDFGDSRPFRNDWIGIDPYFKDKGNKHGTITLVQALTSSCDAYFWQVAGTLNNKKDPSLLAQYADKLWLGKKTGITDIDDKEGQIPSPDNIGSIAEQQGRKWDVVDALNMAIGQGDVKVTPLQVAHMVTPVANGGTFFKPYLVFSVGSANQVTYGPVTPQVQGQLAIDSKVLKGIQEGMCGVTQDPNLGTAAWFLTKDDWDWSKVTICGKTGTAQTGAKQHPNGWFAAYAGPAGGKPEIAVVALVEHGREGSETSGPIVRRIIQAYYHLPFTNFPPFWGTPYEEMADPNASDGGHH